jgi:hypothetical protein
MRLNRACVTLGGAGRDALGRTGPATLATEAVLPIAPMLGTTLS